MLRRLKNRRRRRLADYAAQEYRNARVRQVEAHFHATTGNYGGGHLLEETAAALILEIWHGSQPFIAQRRGIPPLRAWYAIDHAGSIRELSRADVSHLKSPRVPGIRS